MRRGISAFEVLVCFEPMSWPLRTSGGGCAVDTGDEPLHVRHEESRGSIAGMENKVPFIDPSPDPDGGPNEPRTSELLTVGPKATFQWPPDCRWPFVDHKGDNDT